MPGTEPVELPEETPTLARLPVLEVVERVSVERDRLAVAVPQEQDMMWVLLVVLVGTGQTALLQLQQLAVRVGLVVEVLEHPVPVIVIGRAVLVDQRDQIHVERHLLVPQRPGQPEAMETQ